jgi:hypothetical protein
MLTQNLRVFAQACLGVVVGALLAAAIARLAFPPDSRPSSMPEGLLPWNLHNVLLKPREKGFYLLSLALGGTCSYFATRKVLPGRATAMYLWLALILSVPCGNELISRTLAGASFVFPALAALAALAGGGAVFVLTSLRGKPPTVLEGCPLKGIDENPTYWPYFLLLGLLTLILIPSSFEAVASRIGLNFHAVSFVIGPALYFLGDGLLPGKDYYSQYSIGFPWLFHFVMGHSAEQAILRCVIIVISATWLFYAHLIFLLRWLYRSWTAAGIAALTPLILGFHYPEAIPAFFFAPSSSILRYPLLTVCAALTGLWAEAPARPARLVSIAAAAGLSIFLETETGIVMMVAAPLTIFIIHPWRSYIIRPVIAFVAVTLFVFVALVAAAFGPAALKVEFFRQLFEGILIFGGAGFGGWASNWTLTEWNWLYHLVAPGASIATIAVIARASDIDFPDKRRTAVLGFLAASGLMLLAKYTNMSLAGVWQVSSIAPLSVLGWWCVVLVRRIDPGISIQLYGKGRLSRDTSKPLVFRYPVPLRFSLRGVVAVGMILVALVFLYSPSEARHPGGYGLRAWVDYPSLLRRPLVRPMGCVKMDCVADRPAASDIELIASRTRPGEQVAIVVDLYDWTYLLAAHRPPLMFFVPSALTFSQNQLQESLDRINRTNYLFVPKGPNGEPFISHDNFRMAIAPLLAKNFQKDGEGERMVALKRVVPEGMSGAR